MTYAEVDKIAKMVPAELHITLDKAIEQNPGTQERWSTNDPQGPRIDRCRKASRRTCAPRLHACGRCGDFAADRLRSSFRLYKSSKDEITTMYPMTDVEKIGLLKMDFLALTTLTIIDDTLEDAEAAEGVELDMDALPLDDEKTYELFSAGLTSGVFQFESSGMKDILRRFKPSQPRTPHCAERAVSPGPDRRRHDRRLHQAKTRIEKKVEYELPELKDDPGGNLRRHRLPGTGDADRQHRRRLFTG